MAATPRSIDEYLAALDPKRRAALEKVRRAIRAAAPDTEECISYGMPAFRRGKVTAGFAACSDHGSCCPFSGRTIAALGDALTRGREPRERPGLRDAVAVFGSRPEGTSRTGLRYQVPSACQRTVGANVAGSPTKTAAPPAIVNPLGVA